MFASMAQVSEIVRCAHGEIFELRPQVKSSVSRSVKLNPSSTRAERGFHPEGISPPVRAIYPVCKDGFS